MSPIHQAIKILLVEDDPGHARLIEKNLKRAGIFNSIEILVDGQAAIDYLSAFKEQQQEHTVPVPLLMLLDLNLPVLNGYQVLEWLKSDDWLHHIPVIILTTTDDKREVARCYELGCNVYITKPVEYMDFTDAIQKLGFFLSVVQLPGNGEAA